MVLPDLRLFTVVLVQSYVFTHLPVALAVAVAVAFPVASPVPHGHGEFPGGAHGAARPQPLPGGIVARPQVPRPQVPPPERHQREVPGGEGGHGLDALDLLCVGTFYICLWF